MNWMKLIIKACNWIADNVKVANASHQNDAGKHVTRINPATGLPMVNGGLDIAGNPFGTNNFDWHRQNHHNGSSSFSGSYDPFNNRY